MAAPAVCVFGCLACGSELRFTAGARSAYCETCEEDRPLPMRLPAEIPDAPIFPDGPGRGVLEGRSRWGCPLCRAQLSTAEEPRSCPMCATGLEPASPEATPIRPHGYLPFLVTRDAARQQLRREASALGLGAKTIRFAPVYLPWLVVSLEARARYRGERGETWRDDDRIERTTWQSCAGMIDRPWLFIRACASPSLPSSIQTGLPPWDWAFTKPIPSGGPGRPAAEETMLSPSELFSTAMPDFDAKIAEEICSDIGGDIQRITSVESHRSNERVRVILVPAWVGKLAHMDRRFAINARTGKTTIDGHAPRVAADSLTEMLAEDDTQQEREAGGSTLLWVGLAGAAIGLSYLWSR